MIGTTISHYKILEKLGEGGMGAVYLAEDSRLDRRVALKVLPEEMASDSDRLARFEREAKAVAALNHPNIVTLHTIEEADEIRFLAMEHVEGHDLKDEISRGGVALDRFFEIAVPLADALAAAHEKGIAHRDLKPTNVMVTEEGRVKILDFGLAKRVGGAIDEDDETLTTKTMVTQEGQILGTVAYMSPEQAQGHDVDARSDIFSLGIVLYEMVTGQRPFMGDGKMSVLSAILRAAPVPPTEVKASLPQALNRVLQLCLEKSPDKRFQTARDVCNELRWLRKKVESEAAAGASADAPASKWAGVGPQAPTRVDRSGRFGWTFLVAAGVLVSVLAFIGIRSMVGTEDGLPARKHLAVLPVSVMAATQGGDQEIFAAGLVETITSKLTQLEGEGDSLWVVPFAEVEARSVESVDGARRTFGVNLVVTGSLQRDQDRLRLTLNLVDAESLRQIDSAVLDRRSENFMDLQDQSAIRLARMLGLAIGVQGDSALGSRASAPDANELYLRGRGYLLRYDQPSNIETAISLFRSALDHDPAFVEAQASLGEAYWRLYDETRSRIELDRALEASEKAVEMDATASSTHSTLGLIQTATGDHEQAIRSFEAALELEPRSARALEGLARAYEASDRIDEAEQTYRAVITLRPDFWGGYSQLGGFYFRLGRYDESIKPFQTVTELTPDSARGYSNLGGFLYYLDRIEEAREMFVKSIRAEPNYEAYSNLGTIRFVQGAYLEAAGLYEKALAIDPSDYQVYSNLGAALYWSGDAQKARDAHERAGEMIEELLEVNPKEPFLLASFGLMKALTGQHLESSELVEQALSLAGDSVEVLIVAAETFESIGERKRAVDLVGRALKLGYPLESLEQNPTFRRLLAGNEFLARQDGEA
ncbi:MAG: protein kinase [Thermoanaerobaculia bacterium]